MDFGRILPAEKGREAWLRYAPITDTERAKYAALPASAVAVGDSELVRTAQKELVRGVCRMIERPPRERRVAAGKRFRYRRTRRPRTSALDYLEIVYPQANSAF